MFGARSIAPPFVHEFKDTIQATGLNCSLYTKLGPFPLHIIQRLRPKEKMQCCVTFRHNKEACGGGKTGRKKVKEKEENKSMSEWTMSSPHLGRHRHLAAPSSPLLSIPFPFIHFF